MLNKAILHVAAKYLNLDITGCMEEFLGLGIKVCFMFILFLIFYLNVILCPPLVMNLIFQASSWSRKHLKMTLMSTNESPEEEHTSLFYQVTTLGIVSFTVILDFATKYM